MVRTGLVAFWYEVVGTLVRTGSFLVRSGRLRSGHGTKCLETVSGSDQSPADMAGARAEAPDPDWPSRRSPETCSYQ